MNTVIRPADINGIPVLEVFREELAAPMPMALVYHGWTGRREENFSVAYELAGRGFFVVIADAYLHGKRKTQPCVLSLDVFFEVIEKTTEEINMILDDYTGDRHVDSSRMALLGVSMGGCITFNYLMKADRRIAAAVTFVSTPDWLSITEALETAVTLADANGSFIAPSFRGDMAKLKRTASEAQPLGKGSESFNIPLLMLNGGVDILIPANRVYEFYEKTGKDNGVELTVYPEVGHAVTADMITDAAGWLEERLILPFS